MCVLSILALTSLCLLYGAILCHRNGRKIYRASAAPTSKMRLPIQNIVGRKIPDSVLFYGWIDKFEGSCILCDARAVLTGQPRSKVDNVNMWPCIFLETMKIGITAGQNVI